ncbi:hypothetical protein Lalb_Chr11g0072631 [Lupinus albus]|uniref:Uncharacterized protein n=1 Tax=Lupinus albus TaxID=3870 RepID=A0A6A4PSX0_LUPAL|nr:hypothetical protein Lalb_Chr11g0072631 [Lupinus albus]
MFFLFLLSTITNCFSGEVWSRLRLWGQKIEEQHKSPLFLTILHFRHFVGMSIILTEKSEYNVFLVSTI